MINVKITNIKNEQFQANFENQELVDAWLFQEETNGSFGKATYIETISPAILDDQGNIVTPAVTQSIPAEYTVVQTDITAQLADEARKADLKAQGAAARAACDAAFDLISGHNLAQTLTADQITQQATTFAPIVQALAILKRPGVAKALVQAVVPDGIIVSQQLKDDVLAELADF